MVKTYKGGAAMYNKHVISIFLILILSVLSCGCCLTGKKKETPKEPFRGAVDTNVTNGQQLQPPVVKESVPVNVSPEGTNNSTSNYPCPANDCPNAGQPGSSCPINTGAGAPSGLSGTPSGVSGTPSGQVITVAPNTSSSVPEAVIQLPAAQPSEAAGTSTQVDKPVTTPESQSSPLPSPSPEAPSSSPVTPATDPQHSPAETGSFHYANQTDSPRTDSDPYRPVSDEQGASSNKAETEHDSTAKTSSGDTSSSKPKGKTVSLEKEVQTSVPASTPAKKETDAKTTDPANPGVLGVRSGNDVEQSGDDPDGGDMTKASPAKPYVEESTQPKYARGYTDPSSTNGTRQTVPFVSPGIYGEARTSIRIQAVP